MINTLLGNIEILAGAACALLLFAGHFLVGVPIWLNAAVCLALFAGLLLIGSFGLDMRIRREAGSMTMEKLRQKVKEGERNTAKIRRLIADTPDKELRDKIANICDIAERILANFQDDPADLAKAGRFLLYLERFLPLIEKYTRLSATPEGRELLRASNEDDVFAQLLETAEQSFRQGFKNYLEKDAVQLRTLGRTLKKMMTIAEIGK